MSIKVIVPIILLLLIFLFLDRDIVLWESDKNGVKVVLLTDGITKYTAILAISKNGNTEEVKLFNYFDSSNDWKNYITLINLLESGQVHVKYHPRLFSGYSQNLYLLNRNVSEILINGIPVSFDIPTISEAKEWEDMNETLKLN